MAHIVRSQRITAIVIRATIEWMRASGLTPYVEVIRTARHVVLPSSAQGRNGTVLLSLGSKATEDFLLTDREFSFLGNFDSQKHHVSIPHEAVSRMTTQEDPSIVVEFDQLDRFGVDCLHYRDTKVPYLRIVK